MQVGKNVLIGVVLFAVLGPPIGSLLYSVLVEVFGLVITSEGLIRLPSRTDGDLGRLGSKMLAIAALSYLIGFVPALLTGAIVGALRHRLDGITLVAVGVLAGAATSFVVMWLWMQQSSPDAAINVGLDTLPYAMFASAVLSWLFRCRARTTEHSPPV